MRKTRHQNATSSLIAVVSDGIDGAIIHLFRAGLDFLLGGRLFFYVRKPVVAGTEKLRRIVLATRASDALIVDVKLAANVLRELICLVRHVSPLSKNRAEGQVFLHRRRADKRVCASSAKSSRVCFASCRCLRLGMRLSKLRCDRCMRTVCSEEVRERLFCKGASRQQGML